MAREQNLYLIGSHRFYAVDRLEATSAAMSKARKLYQAGFQEEGRALYEEAFALRRQLQQQGSSRQSHSPMWI